MQQHLHTLTKVFLPVHRGRTEKLLYVTEAETESACTFHDITEHYSSAVVTLTL